MNEKKPIESAPGKSVDGIHWNRITQPGAYVCNDTGHLMRVPAAALTGGKPPCVEMIGPNGSPKLTRLSEDSALPVGDLRKKSTELSIKPQF